MMLVLIAGTAFAVGFCVGALFTAVVIAWLEAEEDEE